MKIQFERTGGFAGLKLCRSIDTAELTQAEANQLSTLLRKSRFFDLPESLPGPGPGPDQFHYRLTVESEDGRRTLETDEPAVPMELRPLLDLLIRLCRTGPPQGGS